MNPLNYQLPEPTWMTLQRQYAQQRVAIPVPQAYFAPQPAAISSRTLLAVAATFGSALFLLFGQGSKMQNVLAMQVFGAGVTGLLSA
jgi:hypothetical protein